MAGPDPCTAQKVRELCLKAGFSPDERQSADLAGYLSLLMKWNRVMNLAGASTWREALEHLVFDSFYLADLVRSLAPDEPEAWDLGAGAGLPGIPLRMLWQKGSYWLVESREKRALFLSTVLARHPLPGTRVFQGRAEEFMGGRQADIILSRAFMPQETLLPFIHDYLKPGGRAVLMRNAPAAFSHPWKDAGMVSYAIGGEKRFLCVAEKTA